MVKFPLANAWNSEGSPVRRRTRWATIDYTLTFNYVYESTLPNGTTTNTKIPDTESIKGDATATITYSMGETTKEA